MIENFRISDTVYEICGVKFGVPKRHIMVSDQGRKKRKFANQSDDLNAPPPDLTSLDEKTVMNPVYRDILQILEERSVDYHGDTKMYNSRIAKIVNRSEKTVQRAIQELRKQGFIAVHMAKAKNVEGLVKTDRVIRCWRIFARFGMYPYKKPKWKSDPRPAHNPEKIKQRSGNLLWEPPLFVTVISINKEGVAVKRKQKIPEVQQSEGFRFRLGLFPELMDRCMTRIDMRNAFDGESIDRCGYNSLQRRISERNKQWKLDLAEVGLTPERARQIRDVRKLLRDEIDRVTEKVRVLDHRQGMVQWNIHEALKADDFEKYADLVISNDEMAIQIKEMRKSVSEMIERNKQLSEERHPKNVEVE